MKEKERQERQDRIKAEKEAREAEERRRVEQEAKNKEMIEERKKQDEERRKRREKFRKEVAGSGARDNKLAKLLGKQEARGAARVGAQRYKQRTEESLDRRGVDTIIREGSPSVFNTNQSVEYQQQQKASLKFKSNTADDLDDEDRSSGEDSPVKPQID